MRISDWSSDVCSSDLRLSDQIEPEDGRMASEPHAAHELSITRSIDAPPETVYRIWTERLGEWWAPLPYTTPVVDIDLRPGGRALMLMKGPDGTDLPHEEGVFLEIVPNEKIVFTNAFKAGWIPQDPLMVVIVTFEPETSGTRYTARVERKSTR